eukprot:1309071-Rhodomonas_salina.3
MPRTTPCEPGWPRHPSQRRCQLDQCKGAGMRTMKAASSSVGVTRSGCGGALKTCAQSHCSPSYSATKST